jgi:hypothetical protein
VPHPQTDPRRPPVWRPDPSSSCWDRRYNEPSAYEFSQCGNSPGTRREYAGDAPVPAVPDADLPDRGAWGTSFSPEGEAVRVGRHHPATDSSLPLGKRRWGPLNAGATFKVKELPPSSIWHAPVYDSDADDAEGGGDGAPAAAAAPLSTAPLAVLRRLLLRVATADNAVRGGTGKPVEHPELPGLMLTRRTTVGGRLVDWADGPLWLVGLDTGKAHLTDPLQWLSRVGLLYDAQRHNATGPWGAHPRDGFFHYLVRWQISAITSITPSPPTANTARFRTGSQWGPLPAQSYVVFGGPGGVEVASAAELPPLPRALLDIALQDGARTFFSPLRHRYNFDSGRLLCAPRGAIVGTKPKFFTGRSDGWLFRQYGYMRSGQAARGLQSHPKFSPRTVSIGGARQSGAMRVEGHSPGPGRHSRRVCLALTHLSPLRSSSSPSSVARSCCTSTRRRAAGRLRCGTGRRCWRPSRRRGYRTRSSPTSCRCRLRSRSPKWRPRACSLAPTRRRWAWACSCRSTRRSSSLPGRA